MVKHTRRRGGTWYDPRTWFSSSSAQQPSMESAPAPTQSDFGVGTATPPASSPYGGRKGKKSRRTKRRGTKSRRKH